MKEKKVIDLNKDFDPSLIKEMSYKELNYLASQVRNEIIEKTSINGGHLSSNLGTVELAVSLFHVFSLPEDKVIFDVGHQAYAYKILSFGKLLTYFFTISLSDTKISISANEPCINEERVSTLELSHKYTFWAA